MRDDVRPGDPHRAVGAGRVAAGGKAGRQVAREAEAGRRREDEHVADGQVLRQPEAAEERVAPRAGHVGTGFALSRLLDVAVRYRPELLDYVAATEAVLLHSLIVDVHVAPTTTLDVAVSAIGTTGADRDAAALITTLAWRPLP